MLLFWIAMTITMAGVFVYIGHKNNALSQWNKYDWAEITFYSIFWPISLLFLIGDSVWWTIGKIKERK